MCYGCEDCSFKSEQKKIMYEVHVTVDPESDIELFKKICSQIRVKPIIINNVNNDGTTSLDILTKYNFEHNDLTDPYDIMSDIADELFVHFNVVRQKIETVPWHPEAPTNKNGLTLKYNQYFEAHFEVTNPVYDNDFIRNVGCYISLNGSKRLATYRMTEGTVEDFEEKVRRYEQIFKIENQVKEFCLYDSNPSYDAEWIGDNK